MSLSEQVLHLKHSLLTAAIQRTMDWVTKEIYSPVLEAGSLDSRCRHPLRLWGAPFPPLPGCWGCWQCWVCSCRAAVETLSWLAHGSLPGCLPLHVLLSSSCGETSHIGLSLLPPTPEWPHLQRRYFQIRSHSAKHLDPQMKKTGPLEEVWVRESRQGSGNVSQGVFPTRLKATPYFHFEHVALESAFVASSMCFWCRYNLTDNHLHGHQEPLDIPIPIFLSPRPRPAWPPGLLADRQWGSGRN